MKNKLVFFTLLFTLEALTSMPALAMHKNKNKFNKELALASIILTDKTDLDKTDLDKTVKNNGKEPLSPKGLSKKQEVKFSTRKKRSLSENNLDPEEITEEIKQENKKNFEKENLLSKRALLEEGLKELAETKTNSRENSLESINLSEAEMLDMEELGSVSDEY